MYSEQDRISSLYRGRELLYRLTLAHYKTYTNIWRTQNKGGPDSPRSKLSYSSPLVRMPGETAGFSQLSLSTTLISILYFTQLHAFEQACSRNVHNWLLDRIKPHPAMKTNQSTLVFWRLNFILGQSYLTS